MRVIRKISGEFPAEPALIRAAPGEYSIWTGTETIGTVSSISSRKGWHVCSRLSPFDTFLTFAGAKEDAERRAKEWR